MYVNIDVYMYRAIHVYIYTPAFYTMDNINSS